MSATSATTQPAPDRRPLGLVFVALWVGISAVATPLLAIFVGRMIPPGNGSVQGSGQVFDNQVLFAVSIPVFVFVCLFVLFAGFFFSNRGRVDAHGLPVRGDMRIQVLWMIITTSTVLFLAGFGTYELVKDGSGGGQGPNAAFTPADYQHALNVQVIGQQWEWTYRFPSAGGLETPHLVLPANTLIRLHVTSLDAIHSFWAYQLGVKADANPGEDNIAYVKTNGPLTFSIRCAELCGLWHGYMFDTGRVVPPSQFASWLKQQRVQYGPVMKYLPPYATTYVPDPQLRAG